MKPATRVCFRCKSEKPLDLENFYKDRGRPHGISYECRLCLSLRKRGKEKRVSAVRWAQMTPEQKQRRREVCLRYERTPRGIVSTRLSSYRKLDAAKGFACTITWAEMESIVNSPCFYCGHKDIRGGADRIDNSKGHTMDNIVPCCKLCNLARMNTFTHEETKLLGVAIAKIRLLRGEAPNAGSQ